MRVSMFFASSSAKKGGGPTQPKATPTAKASRDTQQQKQQQQASQANQQNQQAQQQHPFTQDIGADVLKDTERVDADSVPLSAAIDDIVQKEPAFLHWFVQVYVPAVAESVGDVENDDSFDADQFVRDGYKQWVAAGKPRVAVPEFKP